MPEAEELLSLQVVEVRVAVPAGNGVEAGLVVLEEQTEPYRRIQMFVGQPEARAIHVAWSNTVPPRPSTWDLFVTTLSLLEASLRRVVITDVEEERHFFARVDLERLDGGDPLILTARPSDALALALRAYRCEIAVRPEVLDAVGALADGTRPPPPPRRAEPAEVPEDPVPVDPYESGYEYDAEEAGGVLVAGEWAGGTGSGRSTGEGRESGGKESGGKKSGGKKKAGGTRSGGKKSGGSKKKK